MPAHKTTDTEAQSLSSICIPSGEKNNLITSTDTVQSSSLDTPTRLKISVKSKHFQRQPCEHVWDSSSQDGIHDSWHTPATVPPVNKFSRQYAVTEEFVGNHGFGRESVEDDEAEEADDFVAPLNDLIQRHHSRFGKKVDRTISID